MTITILGAGYVGLTTAALFAQAGFTVYALEPNQKRLNVIKQGRSFFYEDGLDPVIADALAKGTFIPTDSYEESVPKSDIVFSCVGTPDNPDGSSNLTYVFSAAEQAATLLSDGAVFVQKSTVPVGTGKKVQEVFKNLGKTIHYVSNPEFLRESTALFDTLYFDRIVVGGDHKPSVERVLDIYRELEKHRGQIASLAGITTGYEHGQYIDTSLNSAELIKVTSNAFLALKISFANSIAKLADQAAADVTEVMNAVGADPRIGRAFLNAGRGYGGGCFPKDVSGLIASGLEYGVDLEIMHAAQQVNDSMPGYVVDKAQDHLGGSLADKHIAVLGLAFKKDTSDTRRSPGIAIANMIDKAGATVTTYDPKAAEEAAEDLRPNITQKESLAEALKDADAVIVATDWQEFIDTDVTEYKNNLKGTLFIDAVNCLPRDNVEKHGLLYVGIGR